MIFQNLRLANGLSRSQLADLTGRSPGYLLKAESATFPQPPAALMDYYVKRGHNRQILASAYRADQRSQRIAWASLYYPETPNPYLTFKGCWYRLIAAAAEHEKQYPSEYALSQGLCIPASAVFRAQRDWYLSDSIITAFNDIEDAVLSGVLIPTPTPLTPLSEVGNNSTIAANQLLTMISFIKKGGPKGYGYGLKLSS